jgi:hypothetical protein
MTKTQKNNRKYKNKTLKKPSFLYNPDDPRRSFDVYIDKNPRDTINIKYTTLDDVKNTIKHLETLYKNQHYSHKRIWQVAMIMKVRLEVIYRRHKKASDITRRYMLSKKYLRFLTTRTTLNEKERRRLEFIYG